MNQELTGTQWRRWHPGFTPVEVLAVVATAAVSLTMLVPALSKVRSQAERGICESNLRHQGVALRAYGVTSGGWLPWRGWFSYTISESKHEAYGYGRDKVLVNLGSLVGNQYLAAWDLVYCPAFSYIMSSPSMGVPTLWNPNVSFSAGGYNYALPLGQRSGCPTSGEEPYPLDKNKLDSHWVKVLTDRAIAEGYPDWKAAAPRGPQPIVIDFVIGGLPGPGHKRGMNVLYSDGHVCRREEYFNGGGSGNLSSFQLWLSLSLKR